MINCTPVKDVSHSASHQQGTPQQTTNLDLHLLLALPELHKRAVAHSNKSIPKLILPDLFMTLS